jgi:hypothetical protein
MNTDPLDQIVATLNFVDPPGALPLTARTLCKNVLITGGVGSGKTTSGINPLLRDTIRFRAGEPEFKTGLFVFDSKTDGTTERVREWATACGREEDVQILGPGGTHGYDPFGAKVGAADVEILAAKLASLSPEDRYGGDNAYWTSTSRAALEAGIALQLMATGSLELHSTLKWLSDLLLSWKTPATEDAWSKAREIRHALCSIASQCSAISYRTMDGYCKMLESWEKLDQKTRGILITVVQHILGPLLSPRIQDIFPAENRPAVRVEDVVELGKILIFRLNAAADPELSSNVGRLLKADLYRAIQQRRFRADDDARLVGLFLDEYPLVATGNQPYFGDVQNLQTMREKRAFVVAATQGFVSLANAVGTRAWEGLRINLTNQIYFRSNEPEVEALARVILGKRTRSQSVNVSVEAEDTRDGGTKTESRHDRTLRVEGEDWIIQPGDLARLEDHEAFYSFAEGERSESPVFLLPDLTAPELDPLPKTQQEMDAAFAKIRDIMNPKPATCTITVQEDPPAACLEEDEVDQNIVAGNREKIGSLPVIFDSTTSWLNLKSCCSALQNIEPYWFVAVSSAHRVLPTAQSPKLIECLKRYVQTGTWGESAEERAWILTAIDATLTHHQECSQLLRDFRGHHGSPKFLKRLAAITKPYYEELGLPVEVSIFDKSREDIEQLLVDPQEFSEFPMLAPLWNTYPRLTFNKLTHSFFSAAGKFRGTQKMPGIDSLWFPKGMPVLVLSRSKLEREFALAAALLHVSFFTTHTAHLPGKAPAL